LPIYQQLVQDIMGWLNRRDVEPLIAGWVSMVENEIAETLRARCMVRFGIQPLDNAYISLPSDFATMESIRDANSGELLELKDAWSGHWAAGFMGQAGSVMTDQINPLSPCVAYRLLADCVEFLPHPWIPDPPDPNWRPQSVLMGWYARPMPLVAPGDTNPVLNELYGVYLFGCMKYGALFELDDTRAAQADAQWQQQVTRANLWKQQSDYSGAPYREEMARVF
jgi:hypothetical protein